MTKSKLTTFFFCAAIAALSLHGGITSAYANVREVDAIALKQVHSFFGKVVVTITDDALRIDDKSGLGFVLVTKAPDWTVSIFRDKDKIAYSEKFEDFANSGLVNEFILTRKGASYRGATAGEATKQFMGFTIKEILWPTLFEFLPLPKTANKRIPVAVTAAYRTSAVDGIPVTQINVIKQDLVAGNLMKDQRQKDLSTTSIEKVKVPTTIFDVPKNYAMVKSVREVVSGPNTREQSDSLQDLLGPDPGRK